MREVLLTNKTRRPRVLLAVTDDRGGVRDDRVFE